MNHHEIKMEENKDNHETLWSCGHCTYDNPNDLTSCEMCNLPRDVCHMYMCCL